MTKLDDLKDCDFCIRHRSHGGKCFGKDRPDINPCLLYEHDPEGTWVTDKCRLNVGYGVDIPKVGETFQMTDERYGVCKLLSINNVEWGESSPGRLRKLVLAITFEYRLTRPQIESAIQKQEQKERMQVIVGGGKA